MQSTVPGLIVKMLRVLMPAPVVLAAERFGAGREGATVWAGVPLHVFSRRRVRREGAIEGRGDVRHFAGPAAGFRAGGTG